MSTLTQKFLQTASPLMQFQRYRGKINIQRPQKPHFERARVLEFTKPYFPKKDPTERCFQKRKNPIKEIEQVNPYNDIIAREVLNWFNHSKMIGIYHMNSIKADEIFKIRVALHQHNMHLKSYGRKIIQKAVDGTKFEAILPLIVSNYCIIFSQEEKLQQLMKITKKNSQMILIGGIIMDRLLSRNELMELSKMSDLQNVRAQFAATLDSIGGQLVNNLEAHSKNLVNILDVYSKSNDQKTE